MTGRRVENLHRTFRNVVGAAGRRFAEDGYDATSIEDIASDAGVSAGTVYNHFGTKGAVLLCTVMDDVVASLDSAVEERDLDASPLDAVMPVITAYLDGVLSVDRSIVAEVFKASFAQNPPPLVADLIAADERAIACIAAILGDLAAEGRLRGDADVPRAANVAFAVMALATMMYMTDPDMDVGDVAPFVRAHLEVAFSGIVSG